MCAKAILVYFIEGNNEKLQKKTVSLQLISHLVNQLLSNLKTVKDIRSPASWWHFQNTSLPLWPPVFLMTCFKLYSKPHNYYRKRNEIGSPWIRPYAVINLQCEYHSISAPPIIQPRVRIHCENVSEIKIKFYYRFNWQSYIKSRYTNVKCIYTSAHAWVQAYVDMCKRSVTENFIC